MEEENNAELIPNNETDDTPLQCTSVKDLIEKYENGTIFCNTEEKTEFEEKSGQIEEAAAAASEKENVPTDSENSSEHENDEEVEGEDANLDKVIPTEPIVEIESILPDEESKIEETKENDSTNEEPPEPLIENPKDAINSEIPLEEEAEEFYKDGSKPDVTDQTEDNSNSNEEQVSVTEILETENELATNDSEQILEEINSEEAAKVIEPSQEKEKPEETEKPVTNNEAEVVEEKEERVETTDFNKRKREDEDDQASKKLGSDSRILLELESDWSSSPDDTNLEPPVLSERIDFIDVKEPLFEKDDKKEMEETVPEEIEDVKPIEAEEVENLPESSEAENVEKTTEYTAIEAELCLQNEVLESKMDENDLEEKSNEMIVEESDKVDEMEVDDSSTNSPMAQEEALEPMDDSDAGHS